MRQSGIIAAAGITALEQMTDRLAEDHANARRLAEGITHTQGLSVELERVQTNIVFFNLVGDQSTAGKLVKRLDEKGIKVLQVGPARLRAVTHYGISAEDIGLALEALAEAMKQ